jgi:hypothetical protein
MRNLRARLLGPGAANHSQIALVIRSVESELSLPDTQDHQDAFSSTSWERRTVRCSASLRLRAMRRLLTSRVVPRCTLCG